MGVRAKPVDPLKAYNWRLEINGLEVAYVSKVTPVKRSLGVHTHSHGGQITGTKTTAGETLEALVLEKIRPAEGQDRFMEDWYEECRTKGASQYWKTIQLFHLKPGEKNDQGERISTLLYQRCSISELELSDHDANDKEGAIMETCTIQVSSAKRTQ